MTARTEVQLIRDANGQPAFAVVPYAQYLVMSAKDAHHYVPHEVVDLVFDNGWTPIRAWREHLGLTQKTVAQRLGISQPAYAEQETSTRLRKSSAAKIAVAFGVEPGQLDF